MKNLSKYLTVLIYIINFKRASFANTKRNERPLNSGQFFFRFILNYPFIERSQKFYQAQLGYSFNISKINSLQKP